MKRLDCTPSYQARRCLAYRLSILLAAVLAGLFGLELVLTAAEGQATAAPLRNGALYSVDSGDFFFPPYPSENNRFGISVGGGITIERFDVAQLHAGWYLDWAARLNPPHPDQLEYGQTIYLSVNTGPCSISKRPASAITEVTHITGSTLIDNLAANPGALWMIGNEPDSIYNCSPVMPDTYAQVYHNLYTFIKRHDPSARLAIGAIVQPTPIRLEYLDKVWDAYTQSYSTTLPTDLWNIHLYALREVAGSWGGGTPPGATHNGIDYPMRASVDMAIISGLVRDMRTWMAAKGEQDKPLIITEYGVLWPTDYCDEGVQPKVCFTEARVARYMTETFDYFLSATDPAIGCGADGNRLVQLWNWYATNDNNIYNGDLFYLNGSLSVIGRAFAAYAAPRVTAYNDQALWSFPAIPAIGSERVTVSLQSIAAEMGNTPSTSATLKFYSKPSTGGDQLVSLHPIRQPLSRYQDTVLTQSEWVATSPGVYTLRADLVPGAADVRPANNTRSVTLDLRPELAARMSVAIKPAWPGAVTATVRMTISNAGNWPARDTLMQTVVSDSLSGQLIFSTSQALDILPKFTRSLAYAVPITRPGVYAFSFLADAEAKLSEPSTANNAVSYFYHAVPDLATQLYASATPATARATFTVTNDGLWPAYDAATRLLVTRAHTPGPAYTATRVIDLLPGQQTAIAFTWPLTQAGLYTVEAATDPDRALVEPVRSNNVATRVLDMRSDLGWSKLSHTPAQPFLGDLPSITVTISTALANTGAYTSPELTITLQVDRPGGLPPYAELARLASLAPGQSVPISFTWTTSSAGVYLLRLSAHLTDTSVERDMANNTVTGQVLIASDRYYMPAILRGSATQQIR
ncbi:MAG: hypothetical protein JW850_15930 [Thermoflexales bacterium]|nr:hypothetical protein [Thermoflexales bacterium]